MKWPTLDADIALVHFQLWKPLNGQMWCVRGLMQCHMSHNVTCWTCIFSTKSCSKSDAGHSLTHNYILMEETNKEVILRLIAESFAYLRSDLISHLSLLVQMLRSFSRNVTDSAFLRVAMPDADLKLQLIIIHLYRCTIFWKVVNSNNKCFARQLSAETFIIGIWTTFHKILHPPVVICSRTSADLHLSAV